MKIFLVITYYLEKIQYVYLWLETWQPLVRQMAKKQDIQNERKVKTPEAKWR